MLLVFRTYFVKVPPPEPKKAAPAATTHAGQPEAPITPNTAAPAAARGRVTLPVVQGTQAETVTVESNLYSVSFSTQGGVVTSWILKNYRDAKNRLLDLVDVTACDTLGFPMSLNLSNSTLTAEVNQGVYVAKESSTGSGTGNDIQPGSTLTSPVTLTFTYSDGKVQVKKQFAFGADYVTNVAVSVFDGKTDLPVEVNWPGGFGDQSLPPAMIASSSQGVYGSVGDLTTASEGKVKEPRIVPGPLQIAGLEDKFFAGIFLPESPDQVAFRLVRQEWTPPNWTEKEKPTPLEAGLEDTQPKPLDFRLFVGPKAVDVLKSVNPPLDSLVSFGWFSIIAKPLFFALRFISDHWVHNYGWAIVILTIIINMAMFPLKFKSLRAAQEMQKVQPVIKGIQDKYKQYKINDPRKQKMNEEIMKVYSEHGINPLGSCLPMLLQLPVLYAFYAVLNVAIELRHAPWILWVTDLSAPDRLVVFGLHIPVLVILMTIASYFSTKLTPQPSVDPSQQRMMMMMPLIFAFMFYRLASGMVLYWLTSSVVQIGQQVFINRRLPPPVPLPVPRKTAAAKS